MPVRIESASHNAEEVKDPHGWRFMKSADEIMDLVYPPADWSQTKDKTTSFQVIQSSYTKSGLPPAMIASPNGLVNAIYNAYSNHHHLRLRPEDVWFAILTQFSFYVNANSEILRDKFVAHEGRKTLKLVYGASGRFDFDFGTFARDMNRLIEENVVDPNLRDWIVPDFTTTSREDEIIASIIMMGTTQNYFRYVCMLLCGIPSITLEGEKRDYQAILDKIEKLTEYGEEPRFFASLLRPVLSRMVRSFDEPDHADIVEFWRKTFSYVDFGSGSPEYSGWVTAFCFWSEKGRCLYQKCTDESASEFLFLDDIQYHKVTSDNVPYGWVKVPVIVDDQGEIVHTEMLAGSLGIHCFSDAPTEKPNGGDEGSEKRRVLNSMRPETAWWIVQKEPVGERQKQDIEHYVEEKKRVYA